MALILNRHAAPGHNALWIGRDVLIRIDSVGLDGEVRLLIDAPGNVAIWRAELVERTLRETGHDLREGRKGEAIADGVAGV